MITKIKNKLNYYKCVIFSKLNIYKDYSINNYSIKINYLHKLPNLQKKYPYYDKFLCHFVKYLPDNSVVIDVGANIGDTLLSMVSGNSKLEYMCIEPDDKFFFDLKKNIAILKKQNTDLKIIAIKELVGLEINNVSLSGNISTKSAIPETGNIKSKNLSKIYDELDIQFSRLSLLKTDVDGFDWDVINSAYDLIDHCPYLYFECLYENEYQMDNYKKLFQKLEKKGYDNFLFFDNFGKNICCVNNLKNVNELLNYLNKFSNRSSSTIYYYDILAYNHNVNDMVDNAVKDYNESINLSKI